MNLTFQSERWEDVAGDIMPWAELQWLEMSTDKDLFHIEMDWEKYAAWDADGKLLAFTVRDSGRLVGWHLSLVILHPHYRSVLHGLQDTYYVIPEYRSSPTIGLRLFLEMEDAARERGARKLIGSTKSYADKSPLFERTGWRKEGIIYTKVIGA
jgi:hypothetical protein